MKNIPKQKGGGVGILSLHVRVWDQLPYMNWDTYGDYCSLRDTYRPELPVERHTESPRNRMEGDLHRILDGSLPIHPRRTLDQFYYSSLSNTERRDKDQTISKWTGPDVGEEGRSKAADNSLLIMVDQLWCWVLDESKV